MMNYNTGFLGVVSSILSFVGILNTLILFVILII